MIRMLGDILELHLQRSILLKWRCGVANASDLQVHMYQLNHKNVTEYRYGSCNSSMRKLILIIFGKNISQKVNN